MRPNQNNSWWRLSRPEIPFSKGSIDVDLGTDLVIPRPPASDSMTKPSKKSITHDQNQEFLKLGSNVNKLFYGDNLEILRRYIPNESVDLVYLDPPFNSKADYNILFKETTGEKSTAQIQAFSDFWHWDTAARDAYEYLTSNEVDYSIATLADSFYRLLGKNDMTAYLFMMTIRLIELHRVLKPTGSLFLHCDPTASHYLKLVLDTIFDKKNFRNEIIWKRTHSHGGANKCGPIHDTIFFYTKSDTYKWHPKPIEYSKKYIENFFETDKDGRLYRATILTGSGIRYGSSGKSWRGTDPTKIGRHWAIPSYVRDLIGEAETAQEALDKLDEIGRIIWTKKEGGTPSFKQYLDDMEGAPLQDLWTDIPPLSGQDSERLGFPTQKPLALLNRIIYAASDENDWVLDPFCGCGTATASAEGLQRHWIGIDITWLAINLVKNRMKHMFPYSDFIIEGEPKDIGAAIELAKNRYQFQWWALSLIGARPVGAKPENPREGKKGADEGIDGWLRFRIDEEIESIIVQVKSGHVGVKDIREFRDVVTRQGVAMGIFLTLEDPTSEMIKEVKTTEPYIIKSLHQKYPKIQILTIEQLLKSEKPDMPSTASAFQQAILAKKASRKATSTLDEFSSD